MRRGLDYFIFIKAGVTVADCREAGKWQAEIWPPVGLEKFSITLRRRTAEVNRTHWCAAGLSPVPEVSGAMGWVVSTSLRAGSGDSRAMARTWSMVSTKWSFMALRRFSGTSATSFSLSLG